MYLVKITTEKTLCYSKAFGFVMREFADLITGERAELELPFTNISQVTYGEDENGRVIAASVHSYDVAKRAFWIQFSAVEQSHRRRGAYTELAAEMQRQARQAGAVNIYTGVSTINSEMLAVAEQMGRQAAVVRFKIPLAE
jgi:hypothetical protein